MSTRTLQRRLAEEGTNFARLSEDLKRQLAEDQLRRTSATVSEIAYIAGYAQPSSFERAFKRWTHRTPTQYRLENP